MGFGHSQHNGNESSKDSTERKGLRISSQEWKEVLEVMEKFRRADGGKTKERERDDGETVGKDESHVRMKIINREE